MKKRDNREQNEGKIMPPALRKNLDDEMTGKSLIDYLCSELSINSTALAGMLQVTHKTLLGYQSEIVSELESNRKSSRLTSLYNFVAKARKHGVDKHLILSMIHEPVDPLTADSGSILSFLVNDPNSDLFEALEAKFIREYLSNHELKRRVLTLSDRDRDTFLNALDTPPEPNENLKALLRNNKK